MGVRAVVAVWRKRDKAAQCRTAVEQGFKVSRCGSGRYFCCPARVGQGLNVWRRPSVGLHCLTIYMLAPSEGGLAAESLHRAVIAPPTMADGAMTFAYYARQTA